MKNPKLVIRKCKLKQKTLTTISINKECLFIVPPVKQLELICIANGNVRGSSHFRKLVIFKNWWLLAIYPWNSTPPHPLQRTENIWQHKGLNSNVHGNIIHNSPNLETTQMSINRWVDKQIIVYRCHGIRLSTRSGWTGKICNNIGEPPNFKNMLSERSWTQKEYIRCYSVYRIFRKRQNYRERKQISYYNGPGLEETYDKGEHCSTP